MRLVLPEEALPAKLALNPQARMSDDEYYYAFCMANPDVHFERSAKGEITIVPPAGGESDYRSVEIAGPLWSWAKRDGRGKAFGSSIEFLLPNGAALSPDAAWVSNEKLSHLTKEQRRKFPPVRPEFVVEVMSPSDRLKTAKNKMTAWMAAGVELGWLVDADHETVYVYRAGQAEPERLKGITTLMGDGPLAGFKINLTDVWAGLYLSASS